MWTTGLVSLSIHEALTFEGTEIALNPDLFNDAASSRPNTGTRPIGNSSISSSAMTKQQQHHQRTGSDSLVAAASDDTNTDDGNKPLNSASFSTVNSGSNKRLEVGDMIDIRVWDPLPSSAKNSPQRALSKRRSPPASKDSSRGGSASNSVTAAEEQTTRKPSSTSATLQAAVSSLEKAKTASTAGSLQYSVDSSFPTADNHKEELTCEKDGDASTASSVDRAKATIEPALEPPSSPKDNVPNTVTAGSDDNRAGMPPTFPRNRADTSDVNPRLLTAKPPTVQRARATMTAPSDGTDVRRRTSAFVPQNATAAKPPGVHSRDISDITTDTYLASNIIPDVGESHADEGEDDDVLSRISSTHTLRFSFVMLVTKGTLTSLKESARTQVSMLRQVADLYNLSSYDMVTVNRISKEDTPLAEEEVSADFVTVTIKEQYISRGDMHFFQKSLIGKWIYEGQRLSNTTKGVQAHAREIRHGKRLAKSGIVTDNTMITFRSRSARIFWLVQISSEMWDYASPYSSAAGEETSCEIYFDKFVSFMHRLFEKWQELEVTHSLTVVFFSRTYHGSKTGLAPGRKQSVGDSDGDHDGTGTKRHLNVDVYGRTYEDYYKTVVENETRADWDSLIVRIKREFVRYPFEVGWNQLENENGRRPSTAAQGNLLEAVNVTLNLMQFHFMDRDLHRVGNSLVIISGGCGVFEVDRGLAGITYQRMMDNGIGSDMLSLGLPPLHTAPFFQYKNELHDVDTHGVDEGKSYHEVPHWMHLSFFSYGDEAYLQDTLVRQSGKIEFSSSAQAPEDIEVGPNGFYIPNLQDESKQSLLHLDGRRASFCAVANVAASPAVPSSTPQSRQRQLISGRDFNDILEACRPDTTRHAMPSALTSLMTLYEVVKQRKANQNGMEGEAIENERENDEAGDTYPASSQLKEWGAVDFDTVASLLARSPSASWMRRSHDLGTSAPSDTQSDRSSPTSSFSSHLSTTLMSQSLERANSMYSYGGGFPLRHRSMVDGIQMQRSPSMDSIDSDDVLKAAEANDDKGAVIHEEDDYGDNDHKEKVIDTNTHFKIPGLTEADRLRLLMKHRDASFFERGRSNLIEQKPAQIRSANPSEGSLESEGTAPISNSASAPQSVGGLGEALDKYNSSSDKRRPSRENQVLKRNVSFGKPREWSQVQSTYSLSSSLGPYGTSPSSQSRPPVLALKGSDPLEPLPVPKGASRGPIGGSGKRSVSSNVGFLVASSPPRANNIGQKTRSPPSDSDDSPLKRLKSKKGHNSKRRSRTLNPFKQQDEEAVLARKSHNRRRWSHVFPVGEVEFKRHAGPNWLSLSQPAVLPLTIDYFPPPQELSTFFIRLWYIEVDIEGTHYKSHSELMMEMIRQRLTQEYQVVPQSVVQESRRRNEAAATLVAQDRRDTRSSVSPAVRGFLTPDNVSIGRGRLLKPKHGQARSLHISPQHEEEIVEHNLSMGHTIHTLRYDPNTDEKKIVVTQLSKRRSHDNSFRYKYMLFSSTTQSYVKVVQDFDEFPSEYRWNQVDHLICGIEAKKVAGEMRFRQVQFALIPEHFSNETEEQAYVEKFQKLLEYLNKLRENDEKEDALHIEIISSNGKRVNPKDRVPLVRIGAVDMMKRITVQLRKGKRDLYEWLDIAVDPTFDTKRSYRMRLEWLAASSSKVDAQIQLILRRSAQYGLKFISIPELSVASNLFLNPLHAPTLLCVLNREDADLLDDAILKRGFVDDGIHLTEKSFLECVKHANQYKFGRRAKVAARQFVHKSGTLFLRLIRDENGKVILVAIENRMLISSKKEISRAAFREVESFVKTLASADTSLHSRSTPVS